jgi:hypothetical protein
VTAGLTGPERPSSRFLGPVGQPRFSRPMGGPSGVEGPGDLREKGADSTNGERTAAKPVEL